MNQDASFDGFTLPFPGGLVDAIADRVAQKVLGEIAQRLDGGSPWLDVEGACRYLGFSRDSLYKLTAARAIPVRRKAGGQGFRFHRGELDAWMETHYPRLDRLG